MSKASRKARNRVYWRNQGGVQRAYGDFRDYADVRGGREALIPRDAKTATSDPVIAEALASQRVSQLQEARRNKTILGIERQASLAEFAAHHLVEKQRSGRFTAQWLAAVQGHLEAAIEFFCNQGRALPRDPTTNDAILTDIRDRDLAAVGVQDVQQYVLWLAKRSNGREATLAGASQRKYLNSLSNLYRRAISEACVRAGHNPVQAMMDKPRDTGTSREAGWSIAAAQRQITSQRLVGLSTKVRNTVYVDRSLTPAQGVAPTARILPRTACLRGP